jgi:diaminopimelate decarboxylase
VGLAGVSVHTVQTVKRTGGQTFVAIDGGTADNSEAVQGQRAQRAIVLGAAGPTERVELVGMHCDSGDVVARDLELGPAESGSLVVTTATGAYAHTTASNYNAVLRPPVVLCEDGVVDVLVRRETIDDLMRRQRART